MPRAGSLFPPSFVIANLFRITKHHLLCLAGQKKSLPAGVIQLVLTGPSINTHRANSSCLLTPDSIHTDFYIEDAMFVKCLTLAVIIFSGISCASHAEEVYRLRMFFGLSLPSGGAVSLKEWQHFLHNEFAQEFDGFNVVDSVGFYKGQPERSKIITLIANEKEIIKAKQLAASYAKQFHQDSVMVVKVPVAEWSFVQATDLKAITEKE